MKRYKQIGKFSLGYSLNQFSLGISIDRYHLGLDLAFFWVYWDR